MSANGSTAMERSISSFLLYFPKIIGYTIANHAQQELSPNNVGTNFFAPLDF
jgi:hypothetical protein